MKIYLVAILLVFISSKAMASMRLPNLEELDKR